MTAPILTRPVRNVVAISALDVGKIVTILDSSEEGERTETSGILISVVRKFADNELESVAFKLGGNDATVRNGMAFHFDADEANSGDYAYFIY